MMMTILFLGGWQLPGFTPDGSWPTVLAAVAIFGAKVFAFLFFFIWVRWTLPRFRYDQLMKLGWVYFIPMAMANLGFAAVWPLLFGGGA
jgi:NADH-quinone oxidoreductase subunit H